MNQRNYNNNCNRSTESGSTAYANNEQVNRSNHYEDYDHVHEVTGSTETVTECRECHNHRFCTVSGRAIRMGTSHVHEVRFCADTSDGHSHEFCDKTSTAIAVGNGKHVHYLKNRTESEDGHVHRLQAATQIESPTDFECKD